MVVLSNFMWLLRITSGTTQLDNPGEGESLTSEPSGNIRFLMFSHYINHIECSGALEGHQTLMANECLTVAAVFGCFHHWECRVEPEAWDKPDWMKVPTMSAEDFRHKFSPTLNLLGNPQHLTYAHPKLPGCCFDNVYHQGRLIGDLPALGKPPSKEHTQKIYNQEYNEIVSWIKKHSGSIG